MVGCLLLLAFIGWGGYCRSQSQTLCDQLLVSTTANVPEIIKDMGPYRRWLDPLLYEAYAQAQNDNHSRKQLVTVHPK